MLIILVMLLLVLVLVYLGTSVTGLFGLGTYLSDSSRVHRDTKKEEARDREREESRVWGTCPYCEAEVGVNIPAQHCPRCHGKIVVHEDQQLITINEYLAVKYGKGSTNDRNDSQKSTPGA